MKLKTLTEKKSKGTYAGVRFSDDTAKRIKAFAEENEIPQPVPVNKLHTTVLYSRKYLPNYKAPGEYDSPLVGNPTKFDVWESQPDEDGKTSNCLVLNYDCPELVTRHKKLMDEHEAEFDFDKFKTHITLSYNIGDMDISNLKPADVGDINIASEYQEELNFDWAKDNT